MWLETLLSLLAMWICLAAFYLISDNMLHPERPLLRLAVNRSGIRHTSNCLFITLKLDYGNLRPILFTSLLVLALPIQYLFRMNLFQTLFVFMLGTVLCLLILRFAIIMRRRRSRRFTHIKLFQFSLALFIIALLSQFSFADDDEYLLSSFPHNRILGDLHLEKVYGNIDDATYSNLLSTFSNKELGLILEEVGTDIQELQGGGGTASPSITLATKGTTGENVYDIQITLPPGRKVVDYWPVFFVGGIVYPHAAVLQPGPNGTHLTVNLYLDGGEEPWNNLEWKCLMNLESVTITSIEVMAMGILNPINQEEIDYHLGDINDF